ncbi:hypothetical protein PC116_g20298 [Phytophthora cactorum]|nr:hypothetical protein PC116_g20298 [Phytophthora cactorum]
MVFSIDDTPGNSLPVSLDTGGALTLTNTIRRRRTISGISLDIGQVKWQALRPYKLKPGKCDALTQASSLCNALSAAMEAVVATTNAVIQDECEKKDRSHPTVSKDPNVDLLYASESDGTSRASETSKRTVVEVNNTEDAGDQARKSQLGMGVSFHPRYPTLRRWKGG